MKRSHRVVVRLGAVSRVVLAQLLGLCGGHMQASAGLDNLEDLLEALEHLEQHRELRTKTSWPL